MTENSLITFDTLGLAPSLLKGLSLAGIKQPTPIQAKGIPVVLTGQDVIGIAQTGTGKTLAFGLPMIQIIAKNKGMGLVVLPTRELAMQVEENLKKVGSSLGLRTALIVGGASMNQQISAIKAKPHIVIATPGRLNDHLGEKTIDLSNVSILVLDEADRMLDMGFEPQIKRILNSIPSTHQTLLFSATMPPEIRAIAMRYMKSPATVQVAEAGSTHDRIAQEIYTVSKDEKMQLLDKMLADHSGTVLVFSRTKHGAKKIAHKIKGMGHTAADIHSNKSLSQRKAALEGFKTGKHRVLVATDIAARGIDVSGIELVVNYDLPDNPEDYVHRIGRTGRAGKAGKAVSFAEHSEQYDVKQIERLMKRNLPKPTLPVLPPKRATPEGEQDRPRSFSNHNRFPRRSFSRR